MVVFYIITNTLSNVFVNRNKRSTLMLGAEGQMEVVKYQTVHGSDL